MTQAMRHVQMARLEISTTCRGDAHKFGSLANVILTKSTAISYAISSPASTTPTLRNVACGSAAQQWIVSPPYAAFIPLSSGETEISVSVISGSGSTLLTAQKPARNGVGSQSRVGKAKLSDPTPFFWRPIRHRLVLEEPVGWRGLCGAPNGTQRPRH
eukprot:6517481-Prymnesium_polylepis.2